MPSIETKRSWLWNLKREVKAALGLNLVNASHSFFNQVSTQFFLQPHLCTFPITCLLWLTTFPSLPPFLECLPLILQVIQLLSLTTFLELSLVPSVLIDAFLLKIHVIYNMYHRHSPEFTVLNICLIAFFS